MINKQKLLYCSTNTLQKFCVLFSLHSNSLFSVTGTEKKTIPPMMEHVKAQKCTPFFPGFKYCSALQYSNAFSSDASPYFPLTGDSK